MELDRPPRKGRCRHKAGRLVRTSSESAKNARPKVKFVTHGGQSALRHAVLDMRTSMGRKYRASLAELKAHVGSDLTVPQAKLIEQATRLSLLSDLAWAEVADAKALITNNTPCAAIDVFLKAARDHRAVLNLLGLERRVKPINLNDYLEGKATQEPA